MRIETLQCKSLLTKSNLPKVDYCINPYVGCGHACIYCYARFMRRFTGHINEKWGDFVDVKVNAPKVLERELSRNPKRKTVLLGSVCDAYQPAEKKYETTRAILKILLKHDFPVSILTKSDLVIRDIDLLKQFSDCSVGLTITTLEEKIARDFEPRSPSPRQRLKALETLRTAGIETYAFVGPILPNLTNLWQIFSALQGKVKFIMAESLNMRCGNWEDIQKVLAEKYPDLLSIYKSELGQEYWDQVAEELSELSRKFNIPLKGFYRH